VFYWDDGRLVAHNYGTGRRMIVNPEIVPFLHHYDEGAAPVWVSRALSRHRLLEPAAGDAHSRRWPAWGALASAFHFGTKDLEYSTNPREGQRRLERQAKRVPMPSPVKPARTKGRAIGLPPAAGDGEFVRALLERRTWRDFGPRPVALQDVATLLQLTWGVHRRGVIRGQGPVVLKTSPSAGACHPGEVYLVAVRVEGLPRGIYHYQADQHRLVSVRRGATPADIVRYLVGQRWYGRAAALFLMTAVFERTQWRYPTARAYRAVLLDAGHLCQTFCLTASWLRLAPFCSMALADSAIERDLGIDGVSEGVLYAAGIGARPRGGWRPGVPGFRDP
jgi:SagB-type dehydrogenase family enzyme